MKFFGRFNAKAWLRRAAYPAFFNLAFLAGIYLTFPYDTLRDRIVSEAERATKMDVAIDKVRLAGFSGIRLHGLQIADPAAAEMAATAAALAEGEEPTPLPQPKVLYLDSASARADMLGLVLGKRAFRFDVEAFGGTLDGRISMGEEEQHFELHARGIDFGQSPLQAFAGLDLAGRVDTLDLEVRSPGPDLGKANGALTIRGDGLQLNGGEVQMFELPQMALGSLEGEVKIEDGVASFDVFQIRGTDLEAEIEGDVRLAGGMRNASINGKLKLKPSEDWWKRNEMLQAAANFALPAGKDGWRTVAIYGMLNSPKFRPQK